MTGAPRLERLSLSDAPALLEVSRSVGWPTVLEDWSRVLSLGTVFGHRAPGGELLSSSAVFPFGPGLAALGMVNVRPSHQGHGLGRAVVLGCLDCLPEPRPPVVLVATPQGLPLYLKLGFSTVDHVVRLRLSGPRGTLPRRAGVGPCLGPEAREVFRLDAEATGGDRRGLLEVRLASGPVALRGEDGSLRGFGLTGLRAGELLPGPIIAPDAQGAAALAAGLSCGHEGPIQLDVPAGQAAFLEELKGWGFQEQHPPAPVMLLGACAPSGRERRGSTAPIAPAVLPGRRERVFAIASRAFV